MAARKTANAVMVDKLKVNLQSGLHEERPSEDTQADMFSGYAGPQSVNVRPPTHDNNL